MNIDRESFNFAHPHYQLLMGWVHNALRQLANTHKALAADIRTHKKAKEHHQKTEKVTKTVAAHLRQLVSIQKPRLPKSSSRRRAN